MSAKHLKVEFDWVITAERVRSYKPSLSNFEFALEMMRVSPRKILHIAQSIYHDVIPAKALGLSTIWVNRRKDKEGFGATPPAIGHPDLEMPDLKTLVSIISFF
ncbi:MAG: HAD hydrolase-like protein [Thermodesulfovibrionales bacterium]|nr:HAD hydrolase-like protein [Thermodesulfovibrionales bacterium]